MRCMQKARQFPASTTLRAVPGSRQHFLRSSACSSVFTMRAARRAFGVVLDGDLVLVKGFGVRDRQSQDAVTPDTVFRIASMTKSFTALAILKLRDEGKL